MDMLFQNLQGEQRYYAEMKCTTLISKLLQIKSRITVLSVLSCLFSCLKTSIIFYDVCIFKLKSNLNILTTAK